MLAETHQEVSRRFLLHAEEQLALGDLLQASEKGWGAAAHAIKAVAERRGWRHRTHRDLYDVIDMIVAITRRPEIDGLFNAANTLHQNFYEGWMSERYIANNLRRVGRLVDILDEVSAADNGNR